MTDESEESGSPAVSVIMPVLNEERHLAESVARVLAQDYPGEVEVILALGPSGDRTDEVAARLVATDRRVRTVSNPTGRTPAGLNAAIRVARHPVIVRVDGHGLLNPGYIKTAVRLLTETGADNVGGIMAAEGITPFQIAVALAMTSKLGVGNAPFHTGGAAGPAETVYLGVFRREIFERLGGYDEAFQRAQDWELNHRIRSAGGLVWFSPELHVTYRPRASVKALASQYYNYGRWRRVVMRTHVGTVSPRYLAPPVAVAALLGGAAAGLVGVVAAASGHRRDWWTRPLIAGWLVPLSYGTGLLGAAAILGRRQPPEVTGRLPLVLATMHVCWGWGFLTSPRDVERATPP